MRLYVGAYWGPRRESADQCAHRLGECLGALGQYSPKIAEWYRERKGVKSPSPRPENWTLFQPRKDMLVELVRAGADRDEAPDYESGFLTGFWNLIVELPWERLMREVGVPRIRRPVSDVRFELGSGRFVARHPAGL